jgi:hypothetical protein
MLTATSTNDIHTLLRTKHVFGKTIDLKAPNSDMRRQVGPFLDVGVELTTNGSNRRAPHRFWARYCRHDIMLKQQRWT